MKSYELINFWSVKDELKKLEQSSNFIMPEDLKKIQAALHLKRHLENEGFYIAHYKKEKPVASNQMDFDYVFSVEKANYKVGDSSKTFYGAVFNVYKWLRRSQEVKEYEFI